MFSSLTSRLSDTLNRLRGVGRLTESNIQESLSNIRTALIEADVALSVVKKCIDQVKEKAIGQQITKSVQPGDALVKIVRDELTEMLGSTLAPLNFKTEPPMVILMAGLQGAGKTTTAAKLALWLQENHKKSVMLTSTDIYRPAAIEQLGILCQQINAHYFPSDVSQKPTDIARNALTHAKRQFYDVLIVDTAGRLHIDTDMMQEIQAISAAVNPTETLLVLDSMTGQDAANIAKHFNDSLALTGVILSKTDGDSRGGAALSMRLITDKPIKFVGVGEKIDDLEVFHPDRAAARILGMGDIISLVEAAQHKMDQKHVDKINKKIKKGNHFDFDDFLSQVKQLRKLGGIKAILGKLPMGMGIPKGASAMMEDTLFVKMEAIILSMTFKERTFPTLLNGSRKRRLAAGSGTTLQDVNKLINLFTQLQKTAKSLSHNKNSKMNKRMQALQGKLPPGLMDL